MLDEFDGSNDYTLQRSHSPPMKPHTLKLRSRSPTPPPKISAPPFTFPDQFLPNPAQNTGEAELLRHLDSHRNHYAPRTFQPPEHDAPTKLEPVQSHKDIGSNASIDGRPARKSSSLGASSELGDLAAKALEVECILTHDISRKLSLQEDRPQPGRLTPAEGNHYLIDTNRSAKTPQLLPPGAAPLPPISPGGSEVASQTSLPSIRLLPEMKLPPLDQDFASRRRSNSTFPQSPPGGHHLPPLSAGHPSPQPPLSPPDSYQKSLPSPGSFTATKSPFAPYQPNGGAARPNSDFVAKVIMEPPSRDLDSLSVAAAPVPVPNRMSIDGITHPQVGTYVCTVKGCTAPAFQTQYLLNSHANVHSSARPHYCPVAGCSRSEGGKGFKRKNEMIRHGLVHDSPGYVCPFCPDRDHRYPRPDNLQRHVRVHHVDKNKDDPALREVLSQRAEGPHRGRRRRGGPH